MNPGDEAIEKLILDGLVEFAAVSKDGEVLYNFTEKAFEEMPAMMEEADRVFSNSIMKLWELGFLLMNPTLDEPIVSLSEKALIQEEKEKLSYEDRIVLEYVIEALRIR